MKVWLFWITIATLSLQTKNEAISVELTASRIRIWGHSKLASALTSQEPIEVSNGETKEIELKGNSEYQVSNKEVGSFRVVQEGSKCPFLVAFMIQNEIQEVGWTKNNDGSLSHYVSSLIPMEMLLQTKNRVFKDNFEDKILKISCLSFDDKTYKVKVSAMENYRKSCGEFECGDLCPLGKFGDDCSASMPTFVDENIKKEVILSAFGRETFLYRGEAKVLHIESKKQEVAVNIFQYLLTQQEPGFMLQNIIGFDNQVRIYDGNLVQIINQNPESIKLDFAIQKDTDWSIKSQIILWVVLGFMVIGAVTSIMCYKAFQKVKNPGRRLEDTQDILFEKKVFLDKQQCALCSGSFEEGQTVTHIIKCGHLLHCHCETKLRSEKKGCPECLRIREGKFKIDDVESDLPEKPYSHADATN